MVDFCSGTGNSILAIASLLPHIHFTLVDIKVWSILFPPIHFLFSFPSPTHNTQPVSLSLALSRAKEAGITNVSTWEGNVHLYDGEGATTTTKTGGGFDIGIATHACGIASDLAQMKCIAHQAAFLICPCCSGKAVTQDLPAGLSFPRSKWLKESLSSICGESNTWEGFMTLASGADHLGGIAACKLLMEMDRLEVSGWTEY